MPCSAVWNNARRCAAPALRSPLRIKRDGRWQVLFHQDMRLAESTSSAGFYGSGSYGSSPCAFRYSS